MSAEHRFAIGGGYLLAVLLVGLVGFAVDWLVLKQAQPRRRRPAGARCRSSSHFRAPPCLRSSWSRSVHRNLPDDHDRINERLIVFVSVLVSAGVIALGYEQLFADATFDTADIRLTEGVTVEGVYITTTDTAVLLITRRTGDCPTITAVRRDRIEQVRIGPSRLELGIPDRELCTRTVDWRDFPAGGG
jgi:hypothetical protein